MLVIGVQIGESVNLDGMYILRDGQYIPAPPVTIRVQRIISNKPRLEIQAEKEIRISRKKV